MSVATAAGSLLAGCMRSPGGGGPGGGPGGGGGADDDGTDGGGDGVTIDPGTTIEFSAQTSHWEGLAPAPIEGTENPTLVLQEGEEYTIGWTESDGGSHNIEIRNENDEIVGDLSTPVVSEPDEAQLLTLTASSEMAQYVCAPHATTMRGDLQFE
nr:plastocyanin/azurin family copper-binding protein [Halomicroarcula sp. SHR3]